MGAVYRAEDTTLDREVALKVLPAELAEDPDRLARFEREAKTLAALDHPNIVHIYSVENATVELEGAANPQTIRFLTMQLVEGQPLSAMIPTGGMPLERIFELAIPLTEALAAAHDKGVVHRDLKPDNIMVTDEGRVKVLDFGLAKLQQVGAALETSATPTEVLTGEGKILGTMPYMSPEQLEGTDLDSRSDIFSLGILLYEMATGARPFQGGTSVSLISSIVKDTPPSVDTVRDELPHHMARIVNRCLEKDPKRRYQTATDVYNELDVLRREVESGIVTSGVTRPTSAEMEAARAPGPASAESSATHSGPVPAIGRRLWPIAAVAAAVLALAAVLWFTRAEGPEPAPVGSTASETTISPESAAATDEQVPAIVVLPFQNRGQSEDEFFADGMSEEITTRLAGISGLRVVSSTSAMQYKENRPPLQQIAEELDVDYVLDGSVRWARSEDDSRVRITPQLVRTSDDSQMWAESYDRVMEDVFEMQSEIASEVVAQLGITLLEPELEELEARPTKDLGAYQAYLRGRHGQSSSDFSEPTRGRVVDDFETAVELDPDFALAWAGLTHAHSFYYRLGYDFTQGRRDLAKAAYDRALELAPDSPPVVFETGYYHYYVEQDHEAALRKFELGAEANPDDPEVLSAIAFVWRRQGKVSEGIENLEQAFEQSPRNAQIPAMIGEYAMLTREYPKSVEYFDISINLEPDSYWPYVIKALSVLNWKGDPDEARHIVDSAPRSGESTPLYFLTATEIARMDRDFEEMIALQDRAPFDWYSHQSWANPKTLVTAEALALSGNEEEARQHYEIALGMIEAELIERPDDYRLHSSLGIALAGLGRKQEAIAAATKGVELMPIEKDVYIGQVRLADLAAIYAKLDEPDAALDQIEILLSIPANFSIPTLRIDPRWDGLRDHPRYQELIEN